MREVDFGKIQEMVKNDAKGRFHLKSEAEDGNEVWWIRANQGHSMKVGDALRVPSTRLTSPPGSQA